MDLGEYLGVGRRALRVQMDFAGRHVLAAFLEDRDNIGGGAASGADQYRFHGSRTEVAPSDIGSAVHHKRMPALGLGDEAHALRTDPFHFADRKSTRLNSSHLGISYAVFCLKKKIT